MVRSREKIFEWGRGRGGGAKLENNRCIVPPPFGFTKKTFW